MSGVPQSRGACGGRAQRGGKRRQRACSAPSNTGLALGKGASLHFDLRPSTPPHPALPCLASRGVHSSLEEHTAAPQGTLTHSFWKATLVERFPCDFTH